VRANDVKAQLASAMLTTNQIKVSSAPLAVVFAADLEPSKNVPRIRELKLADGFPVDFVDRLDMYLKTFSGEGTEHGSMAWAYKQTTFASAAFLYAAAAHGLVTCPMEGFDEGAVRAAVGLPERYSVPIVISLGYPKQGVAPRVSNRLEPTEVFFEGRFGVPMDELFKAS
jgi:nitroreductase